MKEYAHHRGGWRTPLGRHALFEYRLDTSDWNTINSVMGDNDEYHLRDLSLAGLALDVGAHLGAVTIALAIDNPALEVIAVEAVPPNVDLLRTNVALNGLEDRVRVVPLAAAAPGVPRTEVWYGSVGNESAEHHAFIGNSTLVYDVPEIEHVEASIACVSLGALLGDRDAEFLKIDCEGCEWGFLTDPALARVKRIHGEWHPTGGHRRQDLAPLLPGFRLEYHVPLGVDPDFGPGEFIAVRA